VKGFEAELDLGESPWARSARLVGPLFRWAGGKQRFLQSNSSLLPPFSGRYFEPFAGGLSVYFHYVRNSKEPFSAVIGDLNLKLIRCYKEVTSDPDGVSDRIEVLVAGYNAARDKESFYYDVREQHNRVSPQADAARFIFLMAAGWNGVYRNNSKGNFNVPHGAVKSLKVPDRAQLRAVSLVFGMADIRARSWEATINTAREGDFVFLDPPYMASERKDLYDRANQFTVSHQERLAKALVQLQDRGVDFVLTNSADASTQSMYRDLGLSVRIISVLRSVSGNVASREQDTEVVVTPNHEWRTMRENEIAAVLRFRAMSKARKVHHDH
jgi:DNA adenine methylase